MSTTALDAQERTALRAQMERMRVELLGDDLAKVVNLSYGEDERYDHTYLVRIDPDAADAGDPIWCACPACSLGGDYCKHMATVKRVLLGLDDPALDLREDAGEDPDPEAMTDGAGGCPHDHPECEGVDAPVDRPELCYACWDEWAAYDEDDTKLPEDEHVSVAEARTMIETADADD